MKINLPILNRIKRNEFFILVLCLLIGFALRFYTFDRKSLWLDEIYTFNDSRYELKDQLEFYKENPNYFHPPLFFLITHLFYPMTKPERDIRIIPLIFGTVSIPMIYFLARLFSSKVVLPCTLSLTFMAYHISLSQDGRWYSMVMFLGMAGLFFFIKHLKTSKKGYLVLAAFFFATLFHTSYSSILFIAFSQILWFYRKEENNKKPTLYSFLILNSLIFLMCFPWILFILLNYRDQPFIDHFSQQDPISFWRIIYGILHDWAPQVPLLIGSGILLILYPVFARFRKNSFLLLAVLAFPVGGLYLFCKSLNITHFFTSRYFVNFLPIFLITLYLSLQAIEDRFERLKGFLRLRVLFVMLFIASNLVILPLYYQSEKQDFRGLVTYLRGQLNDGDKILVGTEYYIPGMLHYFGVYPKGRFYLFDTCKVSEEEIEQSVSLIMGNKKIIICHSKNSWARYIGDNKRLWILLDKKIAKEFRKIPIFVLKGYFDGSVLNFDRFPTDASMYLLLWDPSTPKGKAIEMPIE